MGAFLNFVVFPKISGLYQKHRLPWHQLEKLGEVFKNNFLTVMQDLKRRIKAGTAKNRCHTISEWSLISCLLHGSNGMDFDQCPFLCLFKAIYLDRTKR